MTPQQHPEPRKLVPPIGGPGNNPGNNGNAFTDEHSLIAQYCQKLHNGDLISAVPDSPLQLMAEIDAEQRHELELMIRELETENANLQVSLLISECSFVNSLKAVFDSLFEY